MNRLITSVLMLLFGFTCYSQEPAQNYEQIISLKNQKIKNVKIMYYTTVDTMKSAGKLVLKKDFDIDGKLKKKYVYTFSDVVSYGHTTTYDYDSKGNLTEKTKIQKILNLGKRDEEFITEMGDNPINEKSYYTYNELNRMVKEENYTFDKKGFDKNAMPNNSVEYTYNKEGKLIKEVGKTPNGRIIYQNYETICEYNKEGNKIKETKTFTTSPVKSIRTTIYSYNMKGQLIEEKREDTETSMNNRLLKYQYDNEGKKTKTLRFSIKDNDWVVIKTFSYDKNGNPILGEEDTLFEYYNNGLIKRELRKSKDNNEVVNFVTTYEYY